MAKQRDAIVIGTGAGGLAAAAYLAKQGLDVVALDQADRIGGFLAPFSVAGFTFDPGVHYIGRARRGQVLDHVLGELGIDVQQAFVEMDPDGFDVYRFPDLEVRMCRGLERYRDRLIEFFPTDRDGLHKFFELLHHYSEAQRAWPLAHHSPRLADVRSLRHMPSVMRWARASFAELLAHYIHDHRARAVLAALDGDVGLPPSRLSALVGLGVLDHYLDGGFYPRGGSGALRDALVDAATKYGAEFRTNAPVVEILTRGSAVRGVRLSDGEELAADVVISDVDPTVTFGQLLLHSDIDDKLLRKVEHSVPSISAFAVYLGMRRDLRSHGFGAFNVWQYPTWDLEAVYAPALAGRLPLPDELSMVLSSSTSRDDSDTLAPAGCSTLQLITFMAWEPFAKWAAIPPSDRGDDYRQLRQEVADRMLAQLDRHWPRLVGDIEVKSIATPLSNTDYVRAVHGGIYGPAHTVGQIGPGRFSTRTPIDGLFLAGAGVNSCGVAACLSSGRTAADAVHAAQRRVRVRASTASRAPALTERKAPQL